MGRTVTLVMDKHDDRLPIGAIERKVSGDKIGDQTLISFRGVRQNWLRPMGSITAAFERVVLA
jgi:hypothetical protein